MLLNLSAVSIFHTCPVNSHLLRIKLKCTPLSHRITVHATSTPSTALKGAISLPSYFERQCNFGALVLYGNSAVNDGVTKGIGTFMVVVVCTYVMNAQVEFAHNRKGCKRFGIVFWNWCVRAADSTYIPWNNESFKISIGRNKKSPLLKCEKASFNGTKCVN